MVPDSPTVNSKIQQQQPLPFRNATEALATDAVVEGLIKEAMGGGSCAFGGSTMQPETIAYAPTCAFTEDSIAGRIAATVGRRAYDHWFLEKTSLTVQDDELTIGVASPFLVDWFQKQFRVPVNQAVREELGASARVRFAVDPEISTAAQSEDREKVAATKRSQQSSQIREMSRG
jgi:hypothetical protein